MWIGLASYYSPLYMENPVSILPLSVLWLVPLLFGWIVALIQIMEGVKMKAKPPADLNRLISASMILVGYVAWVAMSINGYLLID
jgi:hypothetical protein